MEGGRAEIAGGGIGGLTAAAALARRGWQVRLHERDPQIRALGSGIYLWSNGLAVLEDLGILDYAVEGAHYGGAFETRDHRNVVVSRVPVNGDGQIRVVTIVRERLINALVQAAETAGVEIVTGSVVTAVDPEGWLESDGGTRARADLVVVADGVKSRLRDQLGLLRRRRRLRQTCARLLIPRKPGLVPDEVENDYVEFYSGKRFLLYTPSSVDELYVPIVCPLSDREAVGDPLPKDVWARSFPHLGELIEHLSGTPTPRWDDFEWIELHAWSKGKVAVLGDAAHAQPPYLGQGGGCAMGAAVGLAHALEHGVGDQSDRLRQWEAQERPLIEHAQRFAFWLGRMNSVPNAPRSLLLAALGRSARFGRARMRAALTIPRGVKSS